MYIYIYIYICFSIWGADLGHGVGLAGLSWGRSVWVAAWGPYDVCGFTALEPRHLNMLFVLQNS